MNKLISFRKKFVLLTLVALSATWNISNAGPLSGGKCVFFHNHSNVEFGWVAAPEGITTDKLCQDNIAPPTHNHLGGYVPRGIGLEPALQNQVESHNHSTNESSNQNHSHNHSHSQKIVRGKTTVNTGKIVKVPLYTIMSAHTAKFDPPKSEDEN